MREICEKIKINPQELYNGCILMAVAHAVTVGEYPELNYEHSWDGINYCMNNSQGCRGTITFGKRYIIAVFRDMSENIQYQDARNYFRGAPEEIYDELMKNSAHILAIQLMKMQEARKACDDYFGLTDEQMNLNLTLLRQRSQMDFSTPG